MKVGAIIQARMSSRRLPGKVLRPAAGRPLLDYLLDRLERCRELDAVVLATSTEPSDDPVEEFCRERGLPCHRGPLEDVAGRFRAAAELFGFDAFVRVNGDSPFLDPGLVDGGVERFRRERPDAVTNVLVRTFPTGQSVEVFDAGAFARGYQRMRDAEHLEHVTLFFYQHPEEFRIVGFVAGEGEDWSSRRLSIDMPADFERFEAMLARMERPHWSYGWREVLKLQEAVA